MNLEEIRENYRNFDDSKIEYLATDNPNGLKPEVQKILKEEIKRRGLNASLISSVDVMTKTLDLDELSEYVSLIRNLPCPICKSRTVKTNATLIGSVFSLLFISNYEKKLKIACNGCLDEEVKKANRLTILRGWWAFPWGPIQTVRALFFNSDSKVDYQRNECSSVLIGFVRANLGIIEMSKTDSSELKLLIKSINSQ